MKISKYHDFDVSMPSQQLVGWALSIKFNIYFRILSKCSKKSAPVVYLCSEICDENFLAALQYEKSESEQLLKKIYGIAKAHGLYVTWYGKGSISCEPDSFLVSGRVYESEKNYGKKAIKIRQLNIFLL